LKEGRKNRKAGRKELKEGRNRRKKGKKEVRKEGRSVVEVAVMVAAMTAVLK
jgi:hypothetical protein